MEHRGFRRLQRSGGLIHRATRNMVVGQLPVNETATEYQARLLTGLRQIWGKHDQEED